MKCIYCNKKTKQIKKVLKSWFHCGFENVLCIFSCEDCSRNFKGRIELVESSFKH